MTPNFEQEAKAIVNCLEKCRAITKYDWPFVKIIIADALRAAYQKGMQEIREACTQHQHEQFADGYVKGFEAGKEMAAKVADLAPGTNGRWIAKEIRRLRPEGGEIKE